MTVRHVLGIPITVSGRDHVGWSVIRLGFYDLCVSEAVYRLTVAGDTAVDAGANVGAIAVVLARAAGCTGRVVCYEPQLHVLPLLRRNADCWAADTTLAPVDVREAALGAYRGMARFGLPAGIDNPGEARLARPEDLDHRGIDVAVTTLDDDLNEIAVMKIDIEGGELDAFRGAMALLSAGAIRHVVFEDFELCRTGRSGASDYLASHGYTVLRLEASLRGVRCGPISLGNHTSGLEPPSYVASRDPADVVARLAPSGWQLLRRSRGQRAPALPET